MGEAAEPAVFPGGLRKIEVGESMRLARTGGNAKVLEQRLADQVRRAVRSFADTEIDARLAKMQGQQLRVAIGEMEERYVAESRQVVERFVPRLRAPIELETACRRGGERLQEIATS